ncbi:hypothetical protein CXU21_05015 [Akkermansia muciniphila]|nr:hypothetical protein CXU21_05015 [Akkermansia muciniphila]
MTYRSFRSGPCSSPSCQTGILFMAAEPLQPSGPSAPMQPHLHPAPETPLVSIIVPVYNLETCVSACLDSLLAQTWLPLEIILVNDGSTDGTARILNAYAERHPGIRVITQANAGVDAARYAGMDAATGEYVMFVDGDDAIFPDSVEAMVQMAVRERADIVIGDYVRHLDRFGLFRRKDGHIPHSRVVEREEFLSSYYSGFFGMDRHGLFYTYGKMCIKLYRREFLLDNRPAPSGLRYAEDQLFNLQVFPAAERIAVLAREVYIYKFGGVTGNLSLSLFDDMLLLHSTKLTMTDREDWKKSELGAFLNNVRSFLATLAVSGELTARSMPEALEKLNGSAIWRQALEVHPSLNDPFFSAMRRNDAAAAYGELSRHTILKKTAYRLRRAILKLVR